MSELNIFKQHTLRILVSNTLHCRDWRDFCRTCCDWCRVATREEIPCGDLILQEGGPNHMLFQENRLLPYLHTAVRNFLDGSNFLMEMDWQECPLSLGQLVLLTLPPLDGWLDHRSSSDMLLGCNTAHWCAKTFWEDGHTRHLYKYVGWPWVQGTIRHMRATHVVLNEELSTRKVQVTKTW